MIDRIIAPTAEPTSTETMAHPPSPLADPMSPSQVSALIAELQKAVGLHQRGQLDQAAAAYRSILAQVPEQVDALHMLGVLEAQKGNPAAAVELIRRAIAIDPDNPATHNNCGNALRDLKRTDEALASFDRALALRPDYAQALNNRGSALRDLNRLDEALISFDRALALNPNNVETLNNRGNNLRALGRYEEALASYDRALALDPNNTDFHLSRGHALNDLKRYPEAIASYRQALALGGNKELLHYYLAAMGSEASPSTPPLSYVEGLFDQYASRFDEALQRLKYEVPEQLFNAVVAINPAGRRDIADLGCGTGMCGTFFRAIARSMVGVDIAENMIAKSRERGVYDRLVKANLTDFLSNHVQSFDLVIAADVFIYVGDIDAVFAATRTALRPGGQFAFSVESDEGDGFSLRPSRRYAHSLNYLRALAAMHGFVEKAVIPVAIRQGEGQDIPGFNVIFERNQH